MLNDLSERLDSVFRNLRGKGKLTEDNIRESMRDIRRALLEADVHLSVAKQFIKDVTAEAVGEEVIKSISPGQLIVQIVAKKLTELMGGEGKQPRFIGNPPFKIMMVGLQGSGKTTMSAKLALYFRKNKKLNPLLVAADVYRPAAIDQLETLGKSLGITVYKGDTKNPVEICKTAQAYAKENKHDLIIFDTAGRLHIDTDMMDELKNISKEVKPNEILFTADAMLGQDAVNSAKEFNAQLDFTGVVLTKMDGDSRGGAILSILSVTGKPVYFIGTGEKPDALEPFYPDRMASRILGMGDVLSLVEKAQDLFDEEQAKKLEKKMLKAKFTLEDFREQLFAIKKMGPLKQIMGMIPGIGNKMSGLDIDDNMFDKTIAIINSMTLKERNRPKILDGSRRKRIAKGCGMEVSDVNKLMKQYEQMLKMMKKMGKSMKGGKMKGMPNEMDLQGMLK